jgi:sulfide dehydrogenase [flavocytochrome c] flavoprotein chain
MTGRTTRRDVVKAIGAAAAVIGLAPVPAFAQARGRVVVVGGGFGGTTCARYLRKLAPALDVTLIEPNETFVTCPFSNTVIGGLNDLAFVTHSYDKVKAAGITVIRDRVAAIDPASRNVRLASGVLPYDRLVVSPGIDFKWGAIEGYDEAAAEIMPHAFKAGPQTALLRRQLEAMPDGGVVVMSIPANPYRCPPGPYERASLIANYLKTKKPRSKIILLDAKDAFSKMGLFREAWAALYGDLLEWVPFAKNGTVRRVDTATKTIFSDFGQTRADVANIIPPQRSATVVDTAGLAGGGDWCMVNPATSRASCRVFTSSATRSSPALCRSRAFPPAARPRSAPTPSSPCRAAVPCRPRRTSTPVTAWSRRTTASPSPTSTRSVPTARSPLSWARAA